MNLSIKIDPGAAIPTIQQVGAELAALEQKGKAAGPAISSGLREGSIAADRARGGLAGLNDMFAAQNAILARIKGPFEDYERDLKILGELYKTDTINAAEYGAEVNRLEAKINKLHEARSAAYAPKQDPLAGSGGGGSGGSGGIGAALGPLMPTITIAAAATAAIGLGDAYIDLANHASKFASAGHSVDQILGEQFDLSKQLHSGLSATMDVYARIREGTDGLNISGAEQLLLTKELGQAVILSNKPLEEAGTLMNKLSYEFASGTMTSKEMKTMLVQFPAVADVLTETLGKTRAQLMAMAKDGELSANTVMLSFVNAGNILDEKFGRRAETAGQQWQHFKDEMALSIGKLIETSGAIATVGSVLHDVAGVMGTAIDVGQKMRSTFDEVRDSLGFVSKVALAPFNALVHPIETLEAVMRPLPKHFENLSDAVALFAKNATVAHDATEKFLESITHDKFQHMLDGTVKLTEKMGEKPHHEGLSDIEKLLNAILEPTIKYEHEVENLAKLHDKGRLSAEEYARGLALVDKAMPSDMRAKKLSGEAAWMHLNNEEKYGLPNTDASADDKMLRAFEDKLTKSQNAQEKQQEALSKMYDDVTPLEKYQQALQKIDDVTNGLTDDERKRYEGKAEVKYLEEVARQIESNATKYDAWMKKQHSFDAAISEGLKKVRDEVTDTGATIAKSLVDAFHSVNDAIISLVTTGKINFNDLFNTIEQDLARLALQGLEKQLFGAIFSGIGGSIGGSIGGGAAAGLGSGADAVGGGLGAAGGIGSSARVMPFRLDDSHATSTGVSTGSGAPTVIQNHVHIHDDPKALLPLLGSDAAAVHHMNFIRKNAGAIKGLLR